MSNISNSNTNSNNTSNGGNPPGIDALMALYNSIGAPPNQDMGHPRVAAAQALASLASQQPTSLQVPAPAGPSNSPFGLQSLYAHQVQQLTAPQAQQQAQNQALSKSLPPELLQAYLASNVPQYIPQSLLNNAPKAPRPLQQQQLHAQAQAIAAQLLASAQANPDVQRSLSVPNNISSMLQNDLMGSLARAGSANGFAQAADPAAPFKANTAVIKKSEAPASNAPPKKRLKSPDAPSSAQQTKQTSEAIGTNAQADCDDKKLAKRAANRLSAHLSRKRKKMHIDDVTSENIDLRRKVQILQSIPDLIVVFNSSGCISFVSQSVPAFLDMQNQEIEGTTFWDYLTEDSVNLIKSEFMNALAEKRNPEDDSAVLCHGQSLLVKLVDKEGGEPSVVSFKGVVHFTDNAPECISSMRPVATNSVSSSPQGLNQAQMQETTKKSLPASTKPHDVSDIESRKAEAVASNESSGSASD